MLEAADTFEHCDRSPAFLTSPDQNPSLFPVDFFPSSSPHPLSSHNDAAGQRRLGCHLDTGAGLGVQ